MAEKSRLRCAIYTRKSSEEGLEQDFNSLHAQRAACEAYITSQKHEGWEPIHNVYDDGGFSGGSMQRPALDRLLVDIKRESIDVVVVYKVDRLTRSLTDFSKIVDVFDAHNVSFVSVTQAFNTTSSMGRLTLNVLLSFAQFEREVTGERIRDKIAASKKKGMWMGGNVPLGYDARDRTLQINAAEAETVRLIFARYLQTGSVDALQKELLVLNLRTKYRSGRMAHIEGGRPFSHGHLYRILSNPVYIGKIAHKSAIYAGLHAAIIDESTWQRTQKTLEANRHNHSIRSKAQHRNMLSGLLFDEQGAPLIASHAVKDGKRYRYYISQARSSKAQEVGTKDAMSAPVWRLPAAGLEQVVIQTIIRKLRDHDWLLAMEVKPVTSLFERRQILEKYDASARLLEFSGAAEKCALLRSLIRKLRLRDHCIELELALTGNDAPNDASACTSTIIERVSFRRKSGELKMIIESSGPPAPEQDPALIKALGQAHRWWTDLVEGKFATLREVARAYDTDERYAAWIIRLAFISPKLAAQILRGEQPSDFTLKDFIKNVSAGK